MEKQVGTIFAEVYSRIKRIYVPLALKIRFSHLSIRLLYSAMTIVLMAGCAAGPKGLISEYAQYNEAIRRTNDEQLLLNIVRLRYQQSPVFLQIGNIASSYSIGVNLGGSLTQTSDPKTSGVFTTGSSYAENPTITYLIPDTNDFFGKLLTPLGADQLAFLTQIGSPEPIFRLGVRRINGLPNSQGTGDGVITPENYNKFTESLSLIRRLIEAGLIDLSFGSIPVQSSPPINSLNAEGIARAWAGSLEFTRNADGKFIANVFRKVVYLRFTPASDTSADAKRLRSLLRLSNERYNFELMNAMDTREEKIRMRGHKLAAALDPDAIFREIALENRSMMEILFFASKSINVPSPHLKSGIVKASLNPFDGLLRIESSIKKPENAAVRIHYEGYWFFVRADDQRSKWTISLLNSLMAATAGSVPGGQPVLTLPVR